ncbi:GNAT family N-acetyltransferase [Herbivorax sp. ANBcel31]|uniref:GNAT family N-acetyltransferase n=1 Tax=Herbivorax sp. ANBcel31 TaxID=3069754 RepID=UPI0027AE1C91|nr:GNAT family N-acetyltransferase [Herbivorax sp. ANBcel31]MDQ2085046.1 GNAT family N-acetyltransferase [Herbivorax sp. ANBcel31]
MSEYIIREIKDSEIYLLKDFIYEAIFQKDEDTPLPKSVINQPDVRVYIEDFGKPDDLCLVAEIDGKVVGAVWTRILSGEVKGYGNIDDKTPEFAVSLYKGYRGKGIGTALMKSMLKLLKDCGYKKTSLAVQKDNYAVKMYKNVGFEVVKEIEEEYLMVHDFVKSDQY